MKDSRKGIIYMITCGVLWSIAGIFIKKLPWNGFAVASVRSLIAGMTIALNMLIKRMKFVLTKKTLVAGIFAGLTYLCFAVSNKLTTAANAIVIQFTSPIFILIISAVFLHQKVRKVDAAAVLVTLLGVALCFVEGMSGGYLAGNILSVFAGIFMASMYVTLGGLETESRYSACVIGQAVTFLCGLPFVIITRPVFNASTVTFILILGVFQLGLAYILYGRASDYCPPLACCLLGVVEPLLNPVWVMIFDGETPGPVALVGGVIVIVTVTLWCAFANGTDKTAAESQ